MQAVLQSTYGALQRQLQVCDHGCRTDRRLPEFFAFIQTVEHRAGVNSERAGADRSCTLIGRLYLFLPLTETTRTTPINRNGAVQPPSCLPFRCTRRHGSFDAMAHLTRWMVAFAMENAVPTLVVQMLGRRRIVYSVLLAARCSPLAATLVTHHRPRIFLTVLPSMSIMVARLGWSVTLARKLASAQWRITADFKHGCGRLSKRLI